MTSSGRIRFGSAPVQQEDMPFVEAVRLDVMVEPPSGVPNLAGCGVSAVEIAATRS